VNEIYRFYLEGEVKIRYYT